MSQLYKFVSIGKKPNSQKIPQYSHFLRFDHIDLLYIRSDTLFHCFQNYQLPVYVSMLMLSTTVTFQFSF